MLTDDLEQLYLNQIQDFELARNNFLALQEVIYRDIPWGNFTIRLQYNPARMISTNANIDAATLQSRPCFLCKDHMPEQQQGIPFGQRYHIFINPYPIFKKHFTVPSKQHVPQLIGNRFTDMLDLAFELQDYTIFYNGPACGASAPDHFHFQIVPRQEMPLETDVQHPMLREEIIKKDFYSITTLKGYLREVLLLQASDQQLLSSLFTKIQAIVLKAIPSEPEPMFNILCWFDNCQWTVCLFPRRVRRPWQFYATGDEKILFSPGCVDMAGLIIVPRQEDFEKYSPSLLLDMFAQVSPSAESWNQILTHLQTL